MRRREFIAGLGGMTIVAPRSGAREWTAARGPRAAYLRHGTFSRVSEFVNLSTGNGPA